MNMLFTRRSVRSFLPKPVEKEKIQSLLEAAMQAPTAGNGQPCRYIVVESEEARKKLAECHPYAQPSLKASLNIVLVGSLQELCYPEYWQQDCSNAAMNILHQAVELELGGVWMAIAPDAQRVEYIRAMFALPEGVEPFAVLALGYPADANAHRFVSRFDPKKIHWEQW